MAGRINYDDKQQGQVSTFPTNQQWRFLDANEVKNIVNSHADDIEALQSDVFVRNIVDTTSSISASVDDYINADCSSLPITITLPSVLSSTNRTIEIRKTDNTNNNLSIDASLPDLINGVGAIILSNQYDKVTLLSTGSEWNII